MKKNHKNHPFVDQGHRPVAITGATGGLGGALCRRLLEKHIPLILLDRNQTKSAALQATLQAEFPGAPIRRIPLDLADMASVRAACDALEAVDFQCLIHNAGAYSIPRYICDTGYDNVFQINFISPYYMTRRLLPHLRALDAGVVAVGSIAHRYSATDSTDVDFSTRKKASLVYGNAKRYLMYGLHALFAREENQDLRLAVSHPGITFTGITDHYPPLIFALIKHPMKLIFPKPKTACLSILRGVSESTPTGMWWGPRLFDIWGKPALRKLRSADAAERERIARTADDIWERLKEDNYDARMD